MKHDGSVRELVGCGRPGVGDMEVAIVDIDTKERLPEKHIGEIWISSSSLALGYWRKEELTEEMFHARVVGSDRHWYRSGDLGFLHEGEIYISGRLKDLIIMNGRNIHPHDLETFTQEADTERVRPGCAAVFSVDTGEKEKLVVVTEIRDNVKEHDLPALAVRIRDYVSREASMPVGSVVLIKQRALPKTTSGKIQRRQCAQFYKEAKLDVLYELDEEADVQPMQDIPTEKVEEEKDLSSKGKVGEEVALGEKEWEKVHEYQQKILDIVKSETGRTDIDPKVAFASFGFASVDLVRITGKLEDVFEKPLDNTILYRFPTVEKLSMFLAGAVKDTVEESVSMLSNEPIAVVGIGCRFPEDVTSPEKFWELIKSGRDSISEWPAFERGKVEDRMMGGYIRDVDSFDASFFAISDMEAEIMDYQQNHVLETVWHALEDSGLTPQHLSARKTGVYIGASTHDAESCPSSSVLAPTGTATSIIANRVSYFFNFQGPSIVIDSACSSSLVAIHLACNALRSGECDFALAGGVNMLLSPSATTLLKLGGFLSRKGKCFTFDAKADGYTRGEGCGIVVLKPLSMAQKDGDRIYSVIHGTAVNQDGSSNGLTAPNPLSQEAVVKRAQKLSSVSPSQVRFLEAHGTGTLLGDPIEVGALANVFGPDYESVSHKCYLGAVKANIGHLEPASGVAGLIKTSLVLHYKQVPPVANYNHPNPNIDFSKTPFIVPKVMERLPNEDVYAGVSSFGFGGTNAHAVLQMMPEIDIEVEGSSEMDGVVMSRGKYALPVSAKSSSSLRDLVYAYSDMLSGDESINLEQICQMAAVRRAHFGGYRACFVGGTIEEMKKSLDSLYQVDPVKSSQSGVVFMFPGQGSQYTGMAKELYEHERVFSRAFDQCVQGLNEHLSRDLKEVIFETDLLGETQYTQPAIFCVEYSLAQLWLSWGVRPAAVIGHSIGEFVAAVVAGFLRLEDALFMVGRRAKWMQSLPAGGAMMVAPATEEVLQEAITPYSDKVSVAAINGPRLCALSGEEKALEKIAQLLEKQEISLKKLRVSHAFHSPLMNPILDSLRSDFSSIEMHKPNPSIKFMSTVLCQYVTSMDIEYWIDHVSKPVRFYEAFQNLQKEFNLCLELCTRATLTVIVKRFPGENARVVPSISKGPGEDYEHMFKAIKFLYENGVDIKWSALQERSLPYCGGLPVYPFQKTRYSRLLTALARKEKGEVMKPHVSTPRTSTHFIQWKKLALETDGDVSSPPQGKIVVFLPDVHADKIQLCFPGENVIFVEHSTGQDEVSKLDDSHFKVNVNSKARILELLTGFVEGDVSHIVYARALSTDMSKSSQIETFESLVFIVQALLELKKVSKIHLLLSGAFKISETDKDVAFKQAAPVGIMRALFLEHHELYGSVVDLPFETLEGFNLISEIVTSPNYQVAYRDGERYIARLAAFDAKPRSPLAVVGEKSYWIVGGAGDLGLFIAKSLVERGARHIILSGRRDEKSLPDFVLSAIEDIAKDATVHYVQADVCSKEDVKRVIESSDVPLGGIIHGAGIGRRCTLEQMTGEEFWEVASPKILGAHVIMESVEEDNIHLDFVVFMSSVSCELFSNHVSHYAAGNLFLNAFADHLRLTTNVVDEVSCVCFGPFRGLGMAADQAAVMEALGLLTLDADDVMIALDSLHGESTNVLYSPLDYERIKATVEDKNGSWDMLEDLVEKKDSRRQLTQLAKGFVTAGESGKEMVTQYLLNTTKKFMSQNQDALTVTSPLMESGVDSVAAVELRSYLENTLGVLLPATLIFDYPTIVEMSVFLLEKLSKEAGKDVPVSDASPSGGGGASMEEAEDDPVVIVGAGFRLPGGLDDPTLFWKFLCDKGCAINDVKRWNPSEEWVEDSVSMYGSASSEGSPALYCRGGYLEDIDQFDSDFFGISGSEARMMDPQQRLILEVSWEALLDSGVATKDDLVGKNCGVFVGMTSLEYLQRIDKEMLNVYSATGNTINAAAGRVAYSFGFKGPAIAVDTACSSSLLATHLASKSILRGECEMALACGVNVILSPNGTIALSKMNAISPTGECRAFDVNANGFVRGEGCGVLVLQRMSVAKRENRRILSIIRGSSANHDGRSSSFTAPSGGAQQQVLRNALADAKISADEVSFIESHGTGTTLGDPIEAHALAAVFEGESRLERPLVVGALKSNIGHLESASGSASLMKAMLVLQHGEAPPNVAFEKMNPHITLDTPSLYFPQSQTRLRTVEGQERLIAGVSSFGFSGTNVHMLLEAPPQRIEWRKLRKHAWKRRRYWIDKKPQVEPVSTGLALLGGRGHPVLGEIIHMMNDQEMYVRMLLDDKEPTFLQDHCLYNTVVVPGSYYIAMTLCAAVKYAEKNALPEGVYVDLMNVEFLQALVVPKGDKRYLYLHIHPAEETSASPSSSTSSLLPDEDVVKTAVFSVYSSAADSHDLMYEHAKGKISFIAHPKASDVASPLSPVALEEGNRAAWDGEDFYVEMKKVRYDLGPEFRWIERVVAGVTPDDEMEVNLRGPHKGIEEDVSAHMLHPGLVDSCFQALAVFILEEKASGRATRVNMRIPRTIDRIRYRGRVSGPLYCRIKPMENATSHNLTLGLEGGDRLLEIVGFRSAEFTEKAMHVLVGHEPEKTTFDGLYKCAWQEDKITPLPEEPRVKARGEDDEEEERDRHYLIFVDQGKTTIGEYLQEHLFESEVVQPGATGVASLVQKTDWDAIVFLRALDSVADDGSDMSSSHESVLQTALEVVKALAEMPVPPPLYVVTRDTQCVLPIMDEGLSASYMHSTMWGLIRTAVQECPSLSASCVDISSKDDVQSSSLMLAEDIRVLYSVTHHQNAAIRGSTYFTVKLVPSEIPCQLPNKLEIVQRGALDGLTLETRERRALQPEEVEIHVRSVGINFRDVLNVLGLYPGDPGDLGADCAGVVSRVGSNVRDLKPGMSVFGIAPGCFTTHWIGVPNMMVPLPEGLSFEAAATMPVVYLTSYISLIELAKLKKGESVLIHAAAGGVGLAAIAIARAVGAEVYATVGTDEKREYLEAMGVKHIHNSRDTTFGKGVEKDTNGKGIDVVLNCLTSEFIPTSLSILKKGGRFIEIGKRDIYTHERMHEVRPDIFYETVALDIMMIKEPLHLKKLMMIVADELARKAYYPINVTTFPAAKLTDAFRYFSRAKHIGKIVVSYPGVNMDENGTYIITGGTGGLGISFAEWMVEQGARHIVLLSRSGQIKQNEVTMGMMKRLHQSAANVVVKKCDVGDKTDLELVLNEIRRTLPPIRGILHAAGLLKDATIAKQTWSNFVDPFHPKVVGAWNLHTNTLQNKDKLDFFVLFSSISALFGSPGQLNYASANAFLDGLAHYRRARGLPCISVQWGPWKDVGMAAGLTGTMISRGTDLIDIQSGVMALESLLSIPQEESLPTYSVMNMKWKEFFAALGVAPPFLSVLQQKYASGPDAGSGKEARALRERLRSMPSGERIDELETIIMSIVQNVLRDAVGEDDEEIKRDTPLIDVGLDSLAGIEIRNKLVRALGVQLPATFAYEHQSVMEMATNVSDLISGASKSQFKRNESVLPATRELPSPKEESSSKKVFEESEQEVRQRRTVTAKKGKGKEEVDAKKPSQKEEIVHEEIEDEEDRVKKTHFESDVKASPDIPVYDGFVVPKPLRYPLELFLGLVLFCMLTAASLPAFFLFSMMKEHPFHSLIGIGLAPPSLYLGDADKNWPLLVQLLPLAYILFQSTLLLMTLLVKWVVIGKYREGVYDIGSIYFYRWWFVDRLLSLTLYITSPVISGTTIMTLYFKFMGAQIDDWKRMTIPSASMTEFDLIKVGSCVDLSGYVRPRIIENGKLKLAPIKIRDFCSIGPRAYVPHGVVMKMNSELRPLSALIPWQLLPENSVWEGALPRKAKESRLPIDKVTGEYLLHPPSMWIWVPRTIYYLVACLSVAWLFVYCAFPAIKVSSFLFDLLGNWRYSTLVSFFVGHFIFGVTFCVVVVCLKWILIGTIRATEYPAFGWFSLRKWYVDMLVEVAYQWFLDFVEGTLLINVWGRAMGSKIGSRATLLTTRDWSDYDMIRCGNEVFQSQSVLLTSTLNPQTLQRKYHRTIIGNNSWIGMKSVIGAGVVLDDHAAIGAGSCAPTGKHVRSGRVLFGNPGVLSNAKVPSAKEIIPSAPLRYVRLWRNYLTIMAILITVIGTFVATLIPFEFVRWMASSYGEFVGLFSLGPAFILFGIMLMLLCAFLRITVVGHNIEGIHEMASGYVTRYWGVRCLYFVFYLVVLDRFVGTFVPRMFARLLGAKIGRDVYIGTHLMMEHDLLDIGDRVTVEEGVHVIAHIMQYGKMVMGRVKIGDDCSLRFRSFTFPRTTMENGSTLWPVSRTHEGQVMTEGTVYGGSPASSVPSEMLEIARGTQ
eukprot:TRINITY_DN2444_c0_g1_i1.p1 TRINITY_DN2444_c0_g1~~TRINITY_DN2444_c0_g1_i1.p1  ORF type:complete len:4839 (-),score=1309.12 TRINITY_DN2444_c0_g1_i1:231-13373(-)